MIKNFRNLRASRDINMSEDAIVKATEQINSIDSYLNGNNSN